MGVSELVQYFTLLPWTDHVLACLKQCQINEIFHVIRQDMRITNLSQVPLKTSSA